MHASKKTATPDLESPHLHISRPFVYVALSGKQRLDVFRDAEKKNFPGRPPRPDAPHAHPSAFGLRPPLD